MARIKNYLPLLAGLLGLWMVVFLILSSSISKNEGHLIYAVDDAYIHTAMAKNFSQHGVWGITRFNFSSTSSSLLWTLILSLFYGFFGVSEMVPFILNFFLATLLMLFFYYVLEKYAINLWLKFLLLIVFVFCVPLPYLIFCGLEHVLQILLNLLFIYSAVKVFPDNSEKTSPKNRWGGFWLVLLSILVTLVRYEGIFLVFMVSLLLFLKRRFIVSIFCGIAGLLPVMIYGLISLGQGWYFFPSSVILKGHRPDFSSLKGLFEFFYGGVRQLIYNIHLFIVLVIILLLLWFFYRKQRNFWTTSTIMALIFLGTVFFHMFFARSGWFLNILAFVRYDAYLVAMGLFVIMVIWGNLSGENKNKARPLLIQKTLYFLIGCVVILPLLERGVTANIKVVQATSNIYSQQYQMALFLKNYYQNESVVANDIGAINFIADIHCYDLWGLANKEIAELILRGKYSSSEILKFTRSRQARIAIIYDSYLQISGGIPRDWILVARWKIRWNVICSFDTVSFYALNKNEIPHLINSLNEFSSQLPPDVLVSGPTL